MTVNAVVVLLLMATGLTASEAARLQPLRQLQSSDEEVALTFDDGPDPQTTLAVLQLLREYGVKATFFVLGQQAQAYPAVIRALRADGHSVQSHGWRHTHYGRLASNQARTELAQTASVIQVLTGVPVRYFRPPLGGWNDRLVSLAGEQGQQLTLWSIDSRDWQGGSGARIAARVLEQVRPGAILLFHDAPRVERTLQALRILLPTMQAEGYHFVTLQRSAGVSMRPASLWQRWSHEFALLVRGERDAVH